MDYIITMDDSKQYLSHHGVLGMKWGHRKENTSSGRKRTLRKDMTYSQRRQSNRQIIGNIAGNLAGAAVGGAIGGIVGRSYAGSSVGSVLGLLGGTALSQVGSTVNKNKGRTLVFSYLLGPFGASTIYAEKGSKSKSKK